MLEIMSDKRQRGPRGGKTTVSADGKRVRKTFWIEFEEDYQLRKESFERHTPETTLIREMLRERYGLGPLEAPADADTEEE